MWLERDKKYFNMICHRPPAPFKTLEWVAIPFRCFTRKQNQMVFNSRSSFFYLIRSGRKYVTQRMAAVKITPYAPSIASLRASNSKVRHITMANLMITL